MLTEAHRESLFAEVEKAFPFHPVRRGPRSIRKAARVSLPADLNARAAELFGELEEEVLSEILRHLRNLLDFESPPEVIAEKVNRALRRLYAVDAGGNGAAGGFAEEAALERFQALWTASAVEGAEPALLPGVTHLGRIGFFDLRPQDLLPWARTFLAVERYHRLDPDEHENRIERYRTLRAAAPSASIRHPDDLHVWLEHALWREPDRELGDLSRSLARELEARLAPELRPEEPLSAVLYILLRCHRFCLTETMDPADTERLEALHASRRMESLVDVMLLILSESLQMGELPPAGVLLESLRGQGFNLEHRSFRDPYVAPLVPVQETERFEAAPLRFFFPLSRASGRYAEDLAAIREERLKKRLQVLKELEKEYQEALLAHRQPLPKRGSLQRVIRFAVSWALAADDFAAGDLGDTTKRARESLPETAVSRLVRPRKGYEIASRRELTALVEAECAGQREALQRIARKGKARGFHDDAVFLRWAVLREIRLGIGGAADALPSDAGRALFESTLEKAARGDWMVEKEAKWGVRFLRSEAGGPEAVADYLWAVLQKGAATRGAAGEALGETDLESLVSCVTPAFYRLAVAHARAAEGLDRPPAPLDDVPRFVALLAPARPFLEARVARRLKEELEAQKYSLYRSGARPFLLDRGELEAFLAWTFRQHFKGGLEALPEAEDRDRVMNRLQAALESVELAPGVEHSPSARRVVLGWLRGNGAAERLPEEAVAGVLERLPRIDCGSCGRVNCREFAKVLLRREATLEACTQLSGTDRQRAQGILESLRSTVSSGNGTPSIRAAMENPVLWEELHENTPEKRAVRTVLSGTSLKVRRLLMDRLDEHWARLSPKPDIFKCPEPDAFYEEAVSFFGRDTVERLSFEEREFLVREGDARLEAEWRWILERPDWLRLSRRAKESRPLLEHGDPEAQARKALDDVFFLHQLSQEDRERVLRKRLEDHEDGFRHWWNEDLLALKHPGYTLSNWEDFSKIIKNAYWHQEATPRFQVMAARLRDRLRREGREDRLVATALECWVGIEADRVARMNSRTRPTPESGLRPPIDGVEALRDVVCSLVAREAHEEPGPDPGPPVLSREDRVRRIVGRVRERFQREAFAFAPGFSASPGDLSEAERAAFRDAAGRPGGDPGEALRYSLDGDGLEDLTVAMIRAATETSLREDAEVRWLERVLATDSEARPTLKTFRFWLNRRLAAGSPPQELASQWRGFLDRRHGWKQAFFDECLLRPLQLLWLRKLTAAFEGVVPAFTVSGEWERFLEGAEGWAEVLRPELEAIPAMDGERLLHYLFILAKMEGDLDVLTSLLREIRETSDVIEAAWLRFTQDRLDESPPAPSSSGFPLRLPLLAAGIGDKEALNRCLRDGVPRTEKRAIAAAAREIMLYVRFHVLTVGEDRDREPVERILSAVREAGYDLEGIDDEALEAAVRREWHRRESLEGDRVWILTTAVARRIAAVDPDLAEAERAFARARQHVLKHDAGDDPRVREACRRRDIALGRVKEKTYRALSELLARERIESFQRRIRQIVRELDRKRLEIAAGWPRGCFDRRTVFYLLRRFQKLETEPGPEDFRRFLRDHWFLPVRDLGGSGRGDREDRIREIDERIQAVLGVSLLQWVEACRLEAENDFASWLQEQKDRLSTPLRLQAS